MLDMKNIIYNHRVLAEIQMYGIKKDIYWLSWPMEIISRRHSVCALICV